MNKSETILVRYNDINFFAILGHKGPIYALDWHRNNKLLSASGDGTVRIWNAKKEESVLQHPTYVYAAR